MKKVLFRKISKPEKQRKSVSICSITEDADCTTTVKKSFIYKASLADKVQSKIRAPQIYIKKHFDTKNKLEIFDFQVKGYFYMTKDRFILKIRFHHKLNIEIRWKSKVFSPKKSEVLTK